MTSINPWVNRIYNSSSDRSLTITVLTGATIINHTDLLHRKHRENANLNPEVNLRNQRFSKIAHELKQYRLYMRPNQHIFVRHHFKPFCRDSKTYQSTLGLNSDDAHLNRAKDTQVLYLARSSSSLSLHKYRNVFIKQQFCVALYHTYYLCHHEVDNELTLISAGVKNSDIDGLDHMCPA